MEYNKLRDILDKGINTCIILKDNDIIYESSDRGVKPLLDFLDGNNKKTNLVLVDRIIGKGAAILADIIGISEIYTPIISIQALEYIENYSDIKVHFDKKVPYIINRNRDGMCPVESSLDGIHNKDEALSTILKTLEKLKKNI